MSNQDPDKKREYVWHYTNWAGLSGILQSGKLWASHIFYLNDTAEVVQAAKIFESLVTESVRNALMLSWEEDLQPELDRLQELNVCVTSFSKNGDDLSQWRGYASPPPGFAVGFDLLKLKGLAGRANFRLVPCEYNRRVQRQRLAAIVDQFLTKANSQPRDENFPKRLKGLRWKLVQAFAKLAPEFKSARFEAEQEWRLITESTEWLRGLDFHVSKSLVVPHFEFPIWDAKRETSALAAIRIGPNAHIQLVQKSVEMLLRERGYKDAAVYRSKVPFRNW